VKHSTPAVWGVSPAIEKGQGIKDAKDAFAYPREPVFDVHGKIVDWAEHIFEEGMLYARVRFTDKTELCWTLQTAHVILKADLSD